MKLESIKKEFIQFIVLFGIEFNVPIIAFITMRKFVFLYLFILFLVKNGIKFSLRRDIVLATIMMAGLFVYTAELLNIRFGAMDVVPTGAYGVNNLLILILNMIIIPILLLKVFPNITEFVRCQWRVILFQSAIVLVGRFFLPIRMFVFNNFAYGDGRLENGVLSGIRSVGFDLTGAVGSMVLFTGVICGIYLFCQTNSNQEKNKIIVGWMLIIGAQLFMGRTGLYFSIIALFLVVLDGIMRFDKSIRKIVFGGSAIILAILIYVSVAQDSNELRVWVWWITEIGDLLGESRTIDVIGNMEYPELSIETFFGTGLTNGVTQSGIVVDNDSGYIQTYTSIGLLGCVLYYGIIYGLYGSMIRKVRISKKRCIYWMFFLAIIIGEMKEPFLRKSILTVILSCMLMLEMKVPQHVVWNTTRKL